MFEPSQMPIKGFMGRRRENFRAGIPGGIERKGSVFYPGATLARIQSAPRQVRPGAGEETTPI